MVLHLAHNPIDELLMCNLHQHLLNNKIDLEKELEKLINLETNKQLNNFSIIFYKRLRKNLEIYEY